MASLVHPDGLGIWSAIATPVFRGFTQFIIFLFFFGGLRQISLFVFVISSCLKSFFCHPFLKLFFPPHVCSKTSSDPVLGFAEWTTIALLF